MLRSGRTPVVVECSTPTGLSTRLKAESWWVVFSFRSGGVAFSHQRPVSVEAGGSSAPIHDYTVMAVVIGLTSVMASLLTRRFIDG